MAVDGKADAGVVRPTDDDPVSFSEFIEANLAIGAATLGASQGGETADSPASARPDAAAGGMGRYRLGRLLGEGGMGSVFEAEQLHPVQRRVALKLIKLGMDTRQVVSRFQVERQALALMDHPNIAKVFDAGATAHGRPFFAMELVAGEPITRYCDNRSMGLRQRLELFALVCDAVQHAHQKGIIHRDLKPSNVLVAEQDGKRVPKIIDFGIAKATDGSLGDLTVFPATGFTGTGNAVMGTPEYMSPEQAAGETSSIDTRTDVYALGVILYELLSGARPFGRESTPHGTPEELRALIREGDPPRPSTRLDTRSGAAPATDGSRRTVDVTEAARRRATQPGTLVRTLRRELEWIPLKAMRREPSDRYASAAELALDVRNYLAGLPIMAAPPSATYRLRKTLRRHRGAYLTASAVGLALLVGLASATFFAIDASRQARSAGEAEVAVRAEQARTLEEMEESKLAREEAEQVNQFLVDLLRSAMPGQTRGREVTVVEAVGKAAAQIDEKYADRPRLAATVKVTAGQTLLTLSRLEEAEQLLREALSLRERELGSDHPQTGEAMLHLAGALDRRGRAAEAEPLARRAVEVMTAAYGADADLVLSAQTKLGQTLSHQRRSADAEPIHRAVLEARRRLSGPSAQETLWAINTLAATLFELRRVPEAEALFREGLDLARQSMGEDHPVTLDLWGNLGTVLAASGRFDEAAPIIEEALAVHQRVLGERHMDTLTILNTLANIKAETGQAQESLPLFAELREGLEEVLGPDHPRTLAGAANLGGALLNADKPAEAEALLRPTLEAYRKAPGQAVMMQITAVNLGRALVLLGRHEDGMGLIEPGLSELSRLMGPAHPNVGKMLSAAISSLEAQGLQERAAALKAGFAPAAPATSPSPTSR